MRSAIVVLSLVALLPLHARSARADGAPSYDPKAAFRESDENEDGRIDRPEFYARLTEVFFASDADKDGVLDVTEYDAAVAVPGTFDQADTNHDGKVTLQEFYSELGRRSEEADIEKDGTLTLEEVEHAWQAPTKPQ
jgi:hypothetical protein